ncbi:Golgi resident protein GCP60 [Hyalella azteca]|uniref:Golgi resident protein GCP60 n=1 Tax=Hyalella azteca TaxID=294128 RepID=A0A979FQ45_HYAAZ|nr:Golgi resident protein GCP60 [Hyalella azteca]
MASDTSDGANKLSNGINNLNIMGTSENESISNHHPQNDVENKTEVDLESVKAEWGFDLQELYKLVVKFYKEKSGKAIQLTYSERCHLVALTQQVIHGPYDDAAAASQTLGIMDVVGRDRRLAWQSLGKMSSDEAKLEFIEQLHRLAPTLKPYIEACLADHLHHLQLQEEQRLQQEEEHRLQLQKEQERIQQEEIRRQQEQTKREIQAALNQQTFAQFRSYAEHQFPDNPDQQAVLIRQLQDQHYQQYMQQVYQQQLQRQQQQAALLYERDDAEAGDVIAAAAMWTRRDVAEFKRAVQAEGPNTVLRVGHGETVTVRVPTHQDGSCLFWEFATDAYDIGFGLYFEWTAAEDDAAVTVHVTESDEDDDDDDEDGENCTGDADVERGGGKTGGGRRGGQSRVTGPPQSVIIPVYRRDSHQEVYAGSHTYPGTGVYLLKFDNSYSVWRSKTLYYRVYYTQ